MMAPMGEDFLLAAGAAVEATSAPLAEMSCSLVSSAKPLCTPHDACQFAQLQRMGRMSTLQLTSALVYRVRFCIGCNLGAMVRQQDLIPNNRGVEEIRHCQQCLQASRQKQITRTCAVQLTANTIKHQCSIEVSKLYSIEEGEHTLAVQL